MFVSSRPYHKHAQLVNSIECLQCGHSFKFIQPKQKGNTMTLQEWCDKNGTVIQRTSSGCPYIVNYDPYKISHRDLWRLTDYTVSSVCGTTVYFRKVNK